MVDRRQVARRFSKVAESYAQGDFFAREIDRRMFERLDYVRLSPGRILDLGCSRGGSFGGLAERYPDAEIIGLDLSPEMLRHERSRRPFWRNWLAASRSEPLRLAGDAGQLPLPAKSVSMVWSNLLLHWLDHPLPTLREAQRTLELGGLLMFSTLGPDTLRELRAAFADGESHSQRFADMHDLGDMLVESGFADPVMDMEVITLTYDHLDALLAELKGAGSVCAMHDRRRGLSGRDRWQRVRKNYEALRQNGKLPATFEVIYGHAWKAAPKEIADGRAIIRFEQKRR